MYYCIGLWASRATKWWYAAMTDQTCINNRHHHSLDNVMWMKESKQQGMLTVVGENNVSQQVVEDSRTAVEGTLCHTNNHHTIIASRPSWHRQRTTTHTALPDTVTIDQLRHLCTYILYTSRGICFIMTWDTVNIGDIFLEKYGPYYP